MRRLVYYHAQQWPSEQVLLKPALGWLVDDGVRSTENQAACTLIFKELRRDLEVPYFELGTECILLQERISAILRFAVIEMGEWKKRASTVGYDLERIVCLVQYLVLVVFTIESVIN